MFSGLQMAGTPDAGPQADPAPVSPVHMSPKHTEAPLEDDLMDLLGSDAPVSNGSREAGGMMGGGPSGMFAGLSMGASDEPQSNDEPPQSNLVTKPKKEKKERKPREKKERKKRLTVQRPGHDNPDAPKAPAPAPGGDDTDQSEPRAPSPAPNDVQPGNTSGESTCLRVVEPESRC